MNIPPLCIIQARLKSTRLEHKMLLKLNNETLIARAWRTASDAFGAAHSVVAIPQRDDFGPLGDELRRIGATTYLFEGDENDVLARFYFCAHLFRWHPDSVIVRYTADDPFKDMQAMRRVADGERLPVEQGAEAFTLAQLDAARAKCMGDEWLCEHITHAIFTNHPPPLPPPTLAPWTIDDRDDYRAARLIVEGN
jgi:spore coat polysaccharide biosynthesis protein SpsF (cytidylyltransferase family)